MVEAINKVTFDGDGYHFTTFFTCKCDANEHKISSGNKKGDTPDDFTKYVCPECETEVTVVRVVKQKFNPDMTQVEDEVTI